MDSSALRIVLVGTSHPGNIGATARAMKTMGLTDLHLVTPKVFPSAEADARASGAEDILESALVCDDLDTALHGCGLVIGLSARLRSLRWPVMAPRECAEKVGVELATHPVALVFGREKTGLWNEELERCHYLVNIDTNPDYSSLNLAMAVQVMAYEIRVALAGGPKAPLIPVEADPASHDQMQYFYAHLEKVMLDIGFLKPANPRYLVRRLKRLFNRARPDENEINILRGLLSAMEEHIGKADKSA